MSVQEHVSERNFERIFGVSVLQATEETEETDELVRCIPNERIQPRAPLRVSWLLQYCRSRSKKLMWSM